jgi:4-azaleucine resistance transporter AzlC
MHKGPDVDLDKQSTKGLFARGALDTFPLIVAATPFAILYGALALNNGMSFVAALSMSIFVFAGASQFVAVTLVGASAPVLIIIATVFVVNLRHILYSIRFMPNIKSLPKWQRIPMGFWMTDESFSVASRFIDQDKPSDKQLHHYYWGSAIAMYLNWVLFTYIGMLLGQYMPSVTSWGLDIAMVLAFIAIVVPFLKTKSHICCALVAVVSSVITMHWPYKIGLLFSSLLAISVGVLINKYYEIKTDLIKNTTVNKNKDYSVKHKGEP